MLPLYQIQKKHFNKTFFIQILQKVFQFINPKVINYRDRNVRTGLFLVINCIFITLSGFFQKLILLLSFIYRIKHQLFQIFLILFFHSEIIPFTLSHSVEEHHKNTIVLIVSYIHSINRKSTKTGNSVFM